MTARLGGSGSRFGHVRLAGSGGGGTPLPPPIIITAIVSVRAGALDPTIGATSVLVSGLVASAGITRVNPTVTVGIVDIPAALVGVGKRPRARIDMFVRDPNYNIVAQIEDYQKLTIVPRFNDVGNFLIEGADLGFASQFYDLAGYGIVVYRNGIYVMSGIFSDINFSGDTDRDTVRLAGVDDNVILRDKLAYPEPYGNFNLQAYDVRAGAAESIVYGYVDANVGPGADPDRRVNALSLAADQGRGSFITEQARFNNLMELVNGILLNGGDMGWRVVQKLSGGIEFQVYQPTDRTNTAVFSRENMNLLGYSYSVQAPEANHIVCGGGGEGIDRVIREGTDSASVNQYKRRIEQFRDRRDTEEIPIIDQTIAEELAGKSERAGLSLQPVDVGSLAFLEDYYVGDRVTVYVKGVPIREKIREVKMTYTQDGELIEPVVATPENATVNQAYAIMRGRLDQAVERLSRLERR